MPYLPMPFVTSIKSGEIVVCGRRKVFELVHYTVRIFVSEMTRNGKSSLLPLHKIKRCSGAYESKGRLR